MCFSCIYEKRTTPFGATGFGIFRWDPECGFSSRVLARWNVARAVGDRCLARTSVWTLSTESLVGGDDRLHDRRKMIDPVIAASDSVRK